MVVEYLKNYQEFTYTEQIIRDYLLEYPQSIVHLSIKELSVQIHVGMASITRMCKKMGFQGYSDFKLAFMKDMKDLERLHKAKQIKPFHAATTPEQIIEDLPYIYEQAIGYTQIALNKTVLQRVVQKMKNATILIIGTGLHRYVGEIFAYKTEELGLSCHIMDSIHYQSIDALLLRNIPIFAILLSHRSENQAVINGARFLKQHHVPMLLICSQVSEEIREYCDDVLHIIPTYNIQEFGNTQYMMAEQYLLDVIYSMLFIQNLQMIEKMDTGKRFSIKTKGEHHDKKTKK